jgi:putative tricarboxylic transport membrane protein
VNTRKKDRLSGLILACLAIGICIESVRLDVGTLHTPGPGFFSFLSGAVLFLLSFIVFLRSLKGVSYEEEAPFWTSTRGASSALYTLILITLYTIGMNYIGFFISTFVFMAVFLKIIEPHRWLVALLVSLFSSLLAYGIFKVWLDVPLPSGIIGF